MEPEGLDRCIERVQQDGMEITTLATDRHLQIATMMKTKFNGITHQYDVWHVAKGIVKKLTEKAKAKKRSDLSPWIQSISNHLWWCCKECGGNADRLR